MKRVGTTDVITGESSGAGGSARPRGGLLIFVLPAVMDLVLGLLLFVATVRAAQIGGGSLQAAAVLATFSAVYVVVSLLVGRLATPPVMAGLVLAGVILMAVTCGLLTFIDGYASMLALVGVSGLAGALFFTAFQPFMKEAGSARGRSLPASTGLYTFSWSIGAAAGPLAAGFLLQIGEDAAGFAAGASSAPSRLAFVLGAVIAAGLAAVLAWYIRVRPRAEAAPSTAAESDGSWSSYPDRAWLGWIVSGAGLVALSVIKALFPVRGLGPLHLSASLVGALFFTVTAVQAFVGLAMVRSRTWMFRPLPVAGLTVAGLAGLALFTVGETPAVLFAAAALFGVYGGFFFFFLVFHSLVHPQRAAFYVSINEAVVGATGFLAPLAAGAAADRAGYALPLAACAVLVAAVTVLAAAVLGRRAERPALKATARPR